MYTKFNHFSPAISYILGICLAYHSYTEIQQIWSYTDIEVICMKELIVTMEIISTHRMQHIVRIWHMTARKLCVIVGSHFKIWSCTLPSIYRHQTILCLSNKFGTIGQYLQSLSIILTLTNRQEHFNLPRNEELSHFPILIEKYRVTRLLWCDKSHSSWRSFQVFSVPKFDFFFTFSVWLKEVHQQLI